MAQAIPPRERLSAEEDEIRHAYWQYLVKRWLWRAPFAIVPPRVEVGPTLWETPSPEALQDYGYVMVPESQASH